METRFDTHCVAASSFVEACHQGLLILFNGVHFFCHISKMLEMAQHCSRLGLQGIERKIIYFDWLVHMPILSSS